MANDNITVAIFSSDNDFLNEAKRLNAINLSYEEVYRPYYHLAQFDCHFYDSDVDFQNILLTIKPQVIVTCGKTCSDYKKIYGKYPVWNFQENGEEWPAHIQELFEEQVKQRKKK